MLVIGLFRLFFYHRLRSRVFLDNEIWAQREILSSLDWFSERDLCERSKTD